MNYKKCRNRRLIFYGFCAIMVYGLRMKRIRQRAVDKFGERVLLGGDMYDQEEKFFAFAEKRTPEKIEDWLKTLSHKVIRLDGTKPIQETVELIKSLLLWEKGDRVSGG